MEPTPQPPRLARWLLGLRRLGARRADVEADIEELFRARAARSVRHARRRFYGDVMSLWRPRSRTTSVGASRFRPHGRVSAIAGDLKSAARLFRRRPGAIGVTVFGLAIGVGISTAAFTFLNASIRPYGVADPDTLVQVQRTFPKGVSAHWTLDLLNEVRQGARQVSLEGWSYEHLSSAAVDRQSVRIPAGIEFVTGGYLSMLGARATAGRLLTRDDDKLGATTVIVVNAVFWERHFGGDPAIVGRTLSIAGRPVSLVGVVDRSFTGLTRATPAFWAPASAKAALSGTNALELRVVGRLAEGASIAQAEAELDGIAAGLSATNPERTDVLTGVALRPAASGPPTGEIWSLTLVVGAILSLVLLLACANATNLLLASALGRAREMGIRMAIGASPRRIVQQLLTESLLMGAVGAGMGLVLAGWLVPVIAAMFEVRATVDLAPDAHVYAFVAGIGVLVGIGAGLAPARHVARGDLLTPFKGDSAGSVGAPHGRRLRTWLVGIQAASSILLLVLAALFVRAVLRATSLDLGFDADRTLLARPLFPTAFDSAQINGYWQAARARLLGLPGIEAVGLAEYVPFTGDLESADAMADGVPIRVNIIPTDAEYFAALQWQPLRGRLYTPDEVRARAPVAVISENLARRLWPGDRAIGASLERVSPDLRELRVIGIVADAVTAWLREPIAATVYRPIRETRTAYLVARSSGNGQDIVQPVQDALGALDPAIRQAVFTAADRLENRLESVHLMTRIAVSLGAAALFLALVGLAGVTAFATGQRTREIGIRMALGGSKRAVLRLLLFQSLRPVVIGLAIGLAAAFSTSGIIARQLHGLSAYDPVAFATAASVLIAAALLAVLIPASRAMRIDPAHVLRE